VKRRNADLWLGSPLCLPAALARLLAPVCPPSSCPSGGFYPGARYRELACLWCAPFLGVSSFGGRAYVATAKQLSSCLSAARIPELQIVCVPQVPSYACSLLICLVPRGGSSLERVAPFYGRIQGVWNRDLIHWLKDIVHFISEPWRPAVARVAEVYALELSAMLPSPRVLWGDRSGRYSSKSTKDCGQSIVLMPRQPRLG
jgi:hypothetical protein